MKAATVQSPLADVSCHPVFFTRSFNNNNNRTKTHSVVNRNYNNDNNDNHDLHNFNENIIEINHVENNYNDNRNLVH